jgi:hypothetical protein
MILALSTAQKKKILLVTMPEVNKELKKESLEIMARNWVKLKKLMTMMNSLWSETKKENAENSNKKTMTTAILMNNPEAEMFKEADTEAEEEVKEVDS